MECRKKEAMGCIGGEEGTGRSRTREECIKKKWERGKEEENRKDEEKRRNMETNWQQSHWDSLTHSYTHMVHASCDLCVSLPPWSGLIDFQDLFSSVGAQIWPSWMWGVCRCSRRLSEVLLKTICLASSTLFTSWAPPAPCEHVCSWVFG